MFTGITWRFPTNTGRNNCKTEFKRFYPGNGDFKTLSKDIGWLKNEVSFLEIPLEKETFWHRSCGFEQIDDKKSISSDYHGKVNIFLFLSISLFNFFACVKENI